MTTAADQFDDTLSPTDRQFVYLANNVVELLETAKGELERDREAAKASLATASLSCNRKSSAVRALTAPRRAVWRLGRSFACELTLTAIYTAPFTFGISVRSRVEARRTSHGCSSWLLASRRMPTW
jgi:hypothetical protein